MSSPRELYLIRHAIAAERGEEWPDDDKRPLTARGVARFTEVVEGLKKLEAGVDEIFTSPLVRAKQTAELLAAGLPGKPTVKILDALTPGHTPGSLMAQLARTARRRRIALVGHEPSLGELAAHLIGAGRALPFKKGGVCRIDVESLTSRRPGALTWFLQPKMLRGLVRRTKPGGRE
jgi:phosphohistidine phosphatase